MNELSYKSLKLAIQRDYKDIKLIVFMYFDTYFQPRITIPRSVQNYLFLRIPESVKTDNI